MQRRFRLLALPLAAMLLAPLGLSPAAADSGALRPNATTAVSWLVKQTNADGTLSSTGTEPDLGLTLDAALAGMAGGASRATINSWIDAAGKSFKNVSQDKGRVAKALVTLAAAGRSTTSYGGVNPQQIIRSSVTASGHIEGTLPFGQAFGMIGLARTGELPTSTVGFVAGQQCASGAFSRVFDDKSCAAPDPDSTAMMIMALRAAEAKGIAAANAPRTKAVNWLKAQQKPSGAFTGDPQYTPTQNTNSSGIAAAALADLETAFVTKAGMWVSGLQVKSGADAGAVAYNAETMQAANGVVSRVGKGQWVRATTQAVLAFAPIDFFRIIPRFERTAPYTLAGNHDLNGRKWRTTCEPYSKTERCRTEIWATTVVKENGRFVRKDGWTFNNLTYLPYMTESSWTGNPLASHNMDPGFTSGGRQWRTECHTPNTGKGACRAYLFSTVYAASPRAGGGYSFAQEDKWVFNNIVMFGSPAWR
ncbi:MAG: hypothetical protein Q4G35_11040 [Propionibacteriaceae bacterium]|nr:hypothetical protein [Propionibacteriaceae bacterium]